MTPALAWAARTDMGRLRQNNEDTVLVDEPLALAVLADGMGGYQAGEVASALAAQTLVHSWRRWLDSLGPLRTSADVPMGLALSAQAANTAVYEAAHSRADWNGMGTTLVVCQVRGGRLWVGHVGDSRAYRWRGGQLTPLTRDHSLLQEQLDAGLITPEEAVTAVHRNLVTRALGVDASVALEVNEHALAAGDTVLLCSDGLSDMLQDAVIAMLLADHAQAPLSQQAQALVDAANTAGGRDNIAVVLLQARAATPRPAMENAA